MASRPRLRSGGESFSLGLSGYDPGHFNFHAQGDNPIYRGMYEAAALSTGASLVGAELVASRQVEVAFNISGGLHHAALDHASLVTSRQVV